MITATEPSKTGVGQNIHYQNNLSIVIEYNYELLFYLQVKAIF